MIKGLHVSLLQKHGSWNSTAPRAAAVLVPPGTRRCWWVCVAATCVCALTFAHMVAGCLRPVGRRRDSWGTVPRHVHLHPQLLQPRFMVLGYAAEALERGEIPPEPA